MPMKMMLKKWHRYIGFCPLIFGLPIIRQQAGKVFQMLHRGIRFWPGQAIAAGLFVVLTGFFFGRSGQLTAVKEDGEFQSLGHVLILHTGVPAAWIPLRMWNGSEYGRLFLKTAGRRKPLLVVTPEYSILTVPKKGKRQLELQKNFYI